VLYIVVFSDGQFLAVLQENCVEVRYVPVTSVTNSLILSLYTEYIGNCYCVELSCFMSFIVYELGESFSDSSDIEEMRLFSAIDML